MIQCWRLHLAFPGICHRSNQFYSKWDEVDDKTDENMKNGVKPMKNQGSMIDEIIRLGLIYGPEDTIEVYMKLVLSE